MENLEKKIQNLLDLYRSNKLKEAESYNKELIKEHPKVVFLYNSLGLILTAQNNLDEAIKIYERALRIKPDYAIIYNNLGTIYKTNQNFLKAKKYYLKSLSLDNKIPEPYNNLGNLYLALEKYNKAIECYKKAITKNSKFFASYYNLGNIYTNIGDYENAKKYFNETIKLNPHFYPAHRNLSSLKKYSINDNHLKVLIHLYQEEKIELSKKTELLFALGKAFDDIKDFKKAYEYYNTGNKLRRTSVQFSIKKEEKLFVKIKETFNRDLYKKFDKLKNSNTTPIFILGMPRSGTTLVEQILSSHKTIYGADELNFIPSLVKKYSKNQTETDFLDEISSFNDKKITQLGKEYIKNINKISNNSKKVTDKLPVNFKWIGLIKLAIPKATIIHCSRNSKDNCFSIFKNYFVNTDLNFAYCLNDIIGFYKLYENLMNYWKSLFPNFIYDIKYENLIKNPEKEIQNLIKHCKLKWDNNCLQFYKNKRPIKTASFTQARKKIYNTSINSWKNYEEYLESYFDKLNY